MRQVVGKREDGSERPGRRVLPWRAAALAAGMIGGCSGGGTDQSPVADLFDAIAPMSPSEAARDAFDVNDADKRRRAVNLLATADFGGEPTYLQTYQLLVDDPDPTVRAASIRALGLHGSAADVDRISPYLTDPQSPPYVQWEAATALQRLHNPEAVDALLRVMTDETRQPDVRQACATALGQYRERRVVEALIGALTAEDYGVVTEALASLKTLTGQSLGQDGLAWLEWMEGQGDLFASAQTYYYPQYVKPRGLLDKMQFWKEPVVPEPREPRGEVAMTTVSGAQPAGLEQYRTDVTGVPATATPPSEQPAEPTPLHSPVEDPEPAAEPAPVEGAEGQVGDADVGSIAEQAAERIRRQTAQPAAAEPVRTTAPVGQPAPAPLPAAPQPARATAVTPTVHKTPAPTTVEASPRPAPTPAEATTAPPSTQPAAQPARSTAIPRRVTTAPPPQSATEEQPGPLHPLGATDGR